MTINPETGLALVEIFAQACTTASICGRMDSASNGYPPAQVQNLSADPRTPTAGQSIRLSWDRIAQASRYDIDITKTFITRSTSDTVQSPANSYTFEYEEGLKQITVQVKACNERCGQLSSELTSTYKPQAVSGLLASPTNPEYENDKSDGDSLALSWTAIPLANEYGIRLNKKINGVWSGARETRGITSATYSIPYESGLTEFSIRAFGINQGVGGEDSSLLSVAYSPKCGNGRIDAGEQCDPAHPFFSNDPQLQNMYSADNLANKRCIPFGETVTHAGQTRGACEWWPDVDLDGRDGHLDCRNNFREPNMYVGSSYKGSSRVDYNCNGNIDEEVGGCSRLGSADACAASGTCPDGSSNPTGITVCPSSGGNASAFCNALKSSETGWSPSAVCYGSTNRVECSKCIEFAPSRFY